MTDRDVMELRQKLHDYEKLEEEFSNYSSLIFSFANAKPTEPVTIGIYEKKYAFRMDKSQLDKLIHLLADFREETDKKMEEM